MKKLIAICLAGLLMVGCTGKKEANGNDGSSYKVVTGYDQDMRDNGEGLDVSVVRTVKLATTDENLLRMLKKVVLACDSIIVLTDGDVVQSYNMDGSYRCQYGSKGNGGEEYLTISGFYINSDNEVVLVDSYRSCLLRYSLDGAFMGKTDVERPTLSLVNNVLPLDSSSVLISNMISNEPNPLYVTYDINEGTAMPVLSSPLRTDGVRIYIGLNPMIHNKDDVHAVMPFSQYIYDQNGKEVYKIETEKHVLDEKELADITDYDMTAVFDQYMKGNFCGFSSIFETSTHIVCCFYNLSYTVIDKSTLSCNTYEYTSGNSMPEEGVTPLVNLVGSHGDSIIGYLSLDILLSKPMLMELLMKRWNCEISDDDNPVIVFYQIK